MAAEKLVLIAIDGSEEAEQAFDFYVTHLHKEGNKLLLFHGAEVPPMTANEAAAMCQGWWDQVMEGEKKRVKELEERFAERMKSLNLSGKIQAIFCGRPGEIIVDTAEKEGACMIVMGTRGFGVLRRTILGSVSDYVLHHAHCPVTICRRDKHSHEHHKK